LSEPNYDELGPGIELPRAPGAPDKPSIITKHEGGPENIMVKS
jgi:hypothetical protein